PFLVHIGNTGTKYQRVGGPLGQSGQLVAVIARPPVRRPGVPVTVPPGGGRYPPGRRKCIRVVVPPAPLLVSTRSQTWFTTRRPCPGESGGGRRRPAIGSVIRPPSCTWQMISHPDVQMCSVPSPSVWASVLAVISLTARARSARRSAGSPARSAYRPTSTRAECSCER